MMHETYFFIHFCALISFHDSTLLLAAKVRSHSYSIYLSVIMTYFWFVIILVSIDFLVNCYTCSPYLVDTRFLGTERGATVFHCTFQISNLTLRPISAFIDRIFQIKSHTQGFFIFLFCFPFKNKTKISDDSKYFLKINSLINKKASSPSSRKASSKIRGPQLSYVQCDS